MIIQALAAIAALVSATPTAAPVPAKTPHAIVQALYAPYLADPHADAGYKIPASEYEIRRYASKSLKAAIDFDRACEKREQGICNLDGDVLIDGQDWDISQLVISDQPAAADTQVIRVNFINDHTHCQVTFNFVHEGGVWKIDDVEDRDDGYDGAPGDHFWLKKLLRGQS